MAERIKKPWQYWATDGLLSISGLLCLIVGVFHAVRGDIKTGPVFLGAGLVLMLTGTIDRFESIKGLGVEAKVRNLQRKIDEADEALRQVRELAELTAETIVRLSAMMGRWDSYQTQESGYELAQKVREVLTNIGCGRDTIVSVLRPWAQIACRDAGAPLLDLLRRSAIQKITEAQGRIPGGAIDPNTPEMGEYRRLQKEMETFQAKFDSAINLPLEGYPGRFLAIFEETTFIDTDIRKSLLDRALSLKPWMEALSAKCELPNPTDWFALVKTMATPPK